MFASEFEESEAEQESYFDRELELGSGPGAI
jgi:hypothetical protein